MHPHDQNMESRKVWKPDDVSPAGNRGEQSSVYICSSPFISIILHRMPDVQENLSENYKSSPKVLFR